MKEWLSQVCKGFWSALSGRKDPPKGLTKLASDKGLLWQMTLTIEHPTWKKPIVHHNKIRAISISQITKNLTTTSRQNSDLRHRGRTQWVDHRGAIHLLEIKQIN